MGTLQDKINKALESKAAIKAAIEAKGVSDVGDVLAAYPDKIASIQAGGGSGYTGHADAEGLKAIGWTDEDIEYYQTHGVNWNEEDDAYHKVPQDNIDLYGVLTLDNIQEYKERIVYLPKLDTSGIEYLSGIFEECVCMISIPIIDTSSVKDMSYMFASCYALTCVPLFDTSNVETMEYMFGDCYLLNYVPFFDTSKTTDISSMFMNCYSVKKFKFSNTEKCTNIDGVFNLCLTVEYIENIDAINAIIPNYMFNGCYSLRYLYIKNISYPIDLGLCIRIEKESLLYIIENAAPTEPITITLSAYCYNKYNADEDVVAALAKQPNVSLASA